MGRALSRMSDSSNSMQEGSQSEVNGFENLSWVAAPGKSCLLLGERKQAHFRHQSTQKACVFDQKNVYKSIHFPSLYVYEKHKVHRFDGVSTPSWMRTFSNLRAEG